VILFGLYRHVS